MSERRWLMMEQDNSPDILYLYNQGDECTDITGGWGCSSKVRYTWMSPDVATMEKYSDSFKMYIPTGWKAGSIKTNNLINCNGYSKICFDMKLHLQYSTNAVAFMVDSSDTLDGTLNAIYTLMTVNYGKEVNFDGIYKYDISLTGLHQLWIALCEERLITSAWVIMRKIWLEK